MKALTTIITLVCFVLIGTATMADLMDGLLVYFPFDEGKGTVVKDLSGNNRDGKIYDESKVEWVDGQKGFGKALYISGNGFVDKPNADRTGRVEVEHDLDSPKALTFSLWFNAMNDGQWNYLMDMRDTGSWFARLPDSSIQLNGQGSVGGGDYPRKEWVHFVVIADSSSTTYYINGKQVGTKGGAAALNISTNLKIGCRVSRNEGFMGMMDDVAIWDRVLTADEIAQANKGPILKGGTAVDVTGKLSTTWANIKK